ncbi:histidine--tRNA ligase [Flavobacterium solisilvae]|uniref:Histidine--tRNA ligase n=1 Tax=Flavobacterium solisilvae TaxID=1852019 RepID=A0ABX1QT18_9FLAO|nr:histidine--tRNA ligase [Flavobacterium solisilvae]NMH24102.1 histidine--tRNA ligase [Flavobacterium solisilvae]
MAQKPSIPKGTRDFSPVEVSKRNYIMSIMRSHFEKFGYQPIETPTFENSETLMGKYGEEGDRLIFKILNSGDYLENYISVLEVHIKKIFSELMIELSNKLNDNYRESDNENSFRRNRLFVKLFDSDFIDRIVEQLNVRFFKENKLANFYSKELFDIIQKEIDLMKKSKFLKEKILFKALLNCSDCDPNSNKSVNNFVSKKTTEVIGKWFLNINVKYLTPQISEKALRYDLTVPFARYVVQHQNEIEFPFKRYQIQPVWRADRPQKGRFREFYQCDADVVGSTSLWQEVELVQLYDSVFATLGLNGVTIKINNRKILSGIAEVIGASDKLIDFTVALDKLDKIGEEGVKKEMLEKGIAENALEKVQPLFHFSGSIQEKLEKLSTLLSSSEEGMKGIEELRFICESVMNLGLQQANLDLDVTLARGLNYYTGAIFEVSAPEGVAMGSIGGGGRYDDLTGIFDPKSKLSGVGISFGLDRIYLVLEELNLFPETVSVSTEVLFFNLGESQALEAMKAITVLRKNGVKAEMYPDAAKEDKQFKHAQRRNIPFIVKGINGDLFIVKNLVSGEQMEMSLTDFTAKLK